MRKALIVTTDKIDNVILPGKMMDGYVDLACKNFKEDKAYFSILGFFNPNQYPGEAYIEALGAGLEPKDSVCAAGKIASINDEGFLDRAIKIDHDEIEYIAEIIDGTEIEGMRITAHASDGNILLFIDGENVSEYIAPNYSAGGRDAVGQIIALNDKAKKTASVLNKFITRTYKNLNKTKFETKPKPNIILIKSIGRRKDIPGFLPLKGKALCISDSAVSKGVAMHLGMRFSESFPKDIFDLLNEYDIIWIDAKNKKISLQNPPKDVAIAVVSMRKEKFGMLTYPAGVKLFGDFKMKKMIFEKNELLPWILKSPARRIGGND